MAQGTAWSVKGVDEATRAIARRAAQASNMTIGEWIDHAIKAGTIGDTLPGASSSSNNPQPNEAHPSIEDIKLRLDESEARLESNLRPVAGSLQRMAQRLVELEKKTKAPAKPVLRLTMDPESRRLVRSPAPQKPTGAAQNQSSQPRTVQRPQQPVRIGSSQRPSETPPRPAPAPEEKAAPTQSQAQSQAQPTAQSQAPEAETRPQRPEPKPPTGDLVIQFDPSLAEEAGPPPVRKQPTAPQPTARADSSSRVAAEPAAPPAVDAKPNRPEPKAPVGDLVFVPDQALIEEASRPPGQAREVEAERPEPVPPGDDIPVDSLETLREERPSPPADAIPRPTQARSTDPDAEAPPESSTPVAEPPAAESPITPAPDQIRRPSPTKPPSKTSQEKKSTRMAIAAAIIVLLLPILGAGLWFGRDKLPIPSDLVEKVEKSVKTVISSVTGSSDPAPEPEPQEPKPTPDPAMKAETPAKTRAEPSSEPTPKPAEPAPEPQPALAAPAKQAEDFPAENRTTDPSPGGDTQAKTGAPASPTASTPPPAPQIAAVPSAKPKVASAETSTPRTGTAPQPTQQVAKATAPLTLSFSEQDEIDLKARARSGDTRAQHDLGIALAFRDQPDFDEAASWFRDAAINGVANAQYNLGVLYERALGVPADTTRALLWYHSAAEQGHPYAQHNLGVLYAEGRGIPRSYQEAERWFQRAADQGIPASLFNLAVMARLGLNGPDNGAEAERLARKAFELGFEPARKWVSGELDLKGAKMLGTQNLTPIKAAGPPDVEAIQRALFDLGLYEGQIDGIVGEKTRLAISRYQAEHALPTTGLPSQSLKEMLEGQ